ncbi:head GIN domain-containing protein [Flavobacterium adhaerens]|uniref:head GIN domain-containing protein n=1 Tax=Flavobacterium adhaerens TaxID=3149043 RepID=UPI0032B5C353
MLKLITLITKFIVITIIALLFGSCNQGLLNSVTGSGNVTTEKRTVAGDFKNIEISNALDLEIEQSNTTEIIVIADDNLQKDIITNIENGVLSISCKFGNYNNVTSKKVKVKMPVIEGLEASSASTIRSNSTLKGVNLSLVSSSAASINIAAEYENIELNSSSGSSQTIKGKAIHAVTSSSSGSTLNAGELFVNDIDANASSGSSTIVSPIVSLKADASSGSSIVYKKTPKSIEKEEHSGASIHQE